MGKFHRTYKVPSMKTLQFLHWLDDSKRQEIRDLLHGDIDTFSYESVRKWTMQCYHVPDLLERLMYALDEILRTYGVEAIWHDGTLMAVYCNTGQSYDATMVYRYDKKYFSVDSWGDLVEKYHWNGNQ